MSVKKKIYRLPAWLLFLLVCAGLVPIVVAGTTGSLGKAIAAVVISYGALCAVAVFWATRTRAADDKNSLAVHGNCFGPFTIIAASPVALAAAHGTLVGPIVFFVVLLVCLWFFNRYLLRRDVGTVN